MQSNFGRKISKYCFIWLSCTYIKFDDILKLPSLYSFIANIQAIIKTVRGHAVLLSTFSNISKENNVNVTLKLPVITRWGSVITSLKSMLKCKSSLRVLSVSDDTGQLPETIKKIK